VIVATWLILARPSGHPVLRPSPAPTPTGVLTTGGVSIRVPSAWHVIPEVEVQGLRFIDRPGQGSQAIQPILELSNFDPNSQGPRCPEAVAPIPSNGVMLYLEAVVGFQAGISPSAWPLGMDTTPTVPLASDACRDGRTVTWIAAGTVYQATTSIGPQASASDRSALAAAFRSMTFGGIKETGGNLTPTFTIGSVRFQGAKGPVSVYRDPTGSLCIKAAYQGAGSILCDLVPQPGRALYVGTASFIQQDSQGDFSLFLAGATEARVGSLRVSLGTGGWVSARLVTPPSQLDFPFRVFYVEAKLPFQMLNRPLPIVALDQHGQEIGRASYTLRGG
jgi:hypothetical protein